MLACLMSFLTHQWRKFVDKLMGVSFEYDAELMEGFCFSPVTERRAVSTAEVLEWAQEIRDECAKTEACLNEALEEIRLRKSGHHPAAKISFGAIKP